MLKLQQVLYSLTLSAFFHIETFHWLTDHPSMSCKTMSVLQILWKGTFFILLTVCSMRIYFGPVLMTNLLASHLRSHSGFPLFFFFFYEFLFEFCSSCKILQLLECLFVLQEMASQELKEMRNTFTKEAINEHQMAMTGGTKSSLMKCFKCGKKNCTYNQVCMHLHLLQIMAIFA